MKRRADPRELWEQARQQLLLRPAPWTAPVPEPSAAPYWIDVCRAAEDYWSEVANSVLISRDFRAVASSNAKKVAAARAHHHRLPA